MSEQEELATGGVIENGPLIGQDSGHEGMYYDILSDTEIETAEALRKAMRDAIGMGKTVAHVTNNATFCPKCGQLKSLITWSGGDATGVSIPYKFCQCPSEEYKPSNAFPTPESLREFVEQRVEKYLDEKLDERVGKALDELARAFNENKAFKPNPFYVETPGSEHAV